MAGSDYQYGTAESKATGYEFPEYVTQPSQDLAGFFRDYYASFVDPNTGFTQNQGVKQIAGIDPLQQAALGQAPNAVGSWGDQYYQGQGYIDQAGQQMGTLGQYDQNAMQRHMNPYTDGVLNQIQTLGNRNLMENVLPGVNSTFAGNGQFGSTRNADFTNRAIRDNQQAISNAQGTAMNQAYGQAAQDYLGWNTAGQNAAGALGNLGQAQGQYAMSGGTQNWNDLTNLFNMGSSNRAITQEGLTNDYDTWLSSWQRPLDIGTSLGGILEKLKYGIKPNEVSAATMQNDPDSALYTNAGNIFNQVL